LNKIILSNHHPLFLGLFGLFFIVGVFIKSFYLISISFIFLFRYLIDMDFLEKLHNEKPFVYMLFYVGEMAFVGIFLPKIIEKFM